MQSEVKRWIDTSVKGAKRGQGSDEQPAIEAGTRDRNTAHCTTNRKAREYVLLKHHRTTLQRTTITPCRRFLFDTPIAPP